MLAKAIEWGKEARVDSELTDKDREDIEESVNDIMGLIIFVQQKRIEWDNHYLGNRSWHTSCVALLNPPSTAFVLMCLKACR